MVDREGLGTEIVRLVGFIVELEEEVAGGRLEGGRRVDVVE